MEQRERQQGVLVLMAAILLVIGTVWALWGMIADMNRQPELSNPVLVNREMEGSRHG